jgi:hypothetical protein
MCMTATVPVDLYQPEKRYTCPGVAGIAHVPMSGSATSALKPSTSVPG